jgi:hypothetical protein
MDICTVDKKEGYNIIVKDEKRKLKPSELLKAKITKYWKWRYEKTRNTKSKERRRK